jgi:uncharacterized damage-inducible protein DinB
MRIQPILLIVSSAVLTSTAAAQGPVSAAVQRFTARAQRNLVAAAEEMPADKYGYKPTPAQMSFGDVIQHLADGNALLCGMIAGTVKSAPMGEPPPASDSKDKLVEHLKSSFAPCTSLTIDESKLGDSIPFFGGRKITRAAAVFALIDDWADHYSQLAIYLRLNGLLPPTAKKQS